MRTLGVGLALWEEDTFLHVPCAISLLRVTCYPFLALLVVFARYVASFVAEWLLNARTIAMVHFAFHGRRNDHSRPHS